MRPTSCSISRINIAEDCLNSFTLSFFANTLRFLPGLLFSILDTVKSRRLMSLKYSPKYRERLILLEFKSLTNRIYSRRYLNDRLATIDAI